METNQSIINDAPLSGNIITEKMYNITTLWIFKAPIIIVVISVTAFLFGYWFPYLVIALPILLIANPLTRANFHYSIEDKVLKIRQGVISKKDFMLPYGVIQNVIVKQDIFDRIFGLATLHIQNAVAGNDPRAIALAKQDGNQANSLGASKNGVNFVGLKKADAEILKNIILRKMEGNKIDDRGSGL
jgi:uncharacterized membrane protein YdbT with pleckstrin-like domain